ncbi:hypothetical protein [Solitalea koreensis]|uniref:Lipoprotein n=1 Tax=Solitalea koreensis TaxID=543615 RepID=A0A521B198_9SPHI|nr:hypothetical protein [Solitalea koreensis]SMO40847.1 hypothetical protein SAMN06265350_101605 [Solitalea koreensis]
MKKTAIFLLTAFLAASVLESCSSSEHCPAYRSNYPAKAVTSKGKKKDRFKD